MAKLFTRLPEGMSLARPVASISTFAGVGLIGFAPGTWGSLAAVFAAVPVAVFGGPASLLPLAALAFLAGTIAVDIYCHVAEKEDPSEVVIDEVAAQWLVLAVLPVTPLAWLLGFAFFRLFDIWKPWPIRLVEKGAKGSLGVMLDDIVAAVFAMLAANLVLIALSA